MAREVRVRVPEGVHIVVSRGSRSAMDLQELIYSHLLLSLRAYFGANVKFAWNSPEDWVKFCNGKKVRILVQDDEREVLVDVNHAKERVVYVKPVVRDEK